MKFNKSFGYSATWKKGDGKIIIDILKKECLEGIRKNLEYLLTLPDDKLLEYLEEIEWDDEE